MAGALLLFPATAALGTVLYLPIISNIFFITVALDFKGTWLITGLMLLANIYLLCWEFDRWQALIPGFNKSDLEIGTKHLSFLSTAIASGVSGILAVGLFYTLLGIVENRNVLYPLSLAVGSLAVSGFLLVRYRSKHVLN
jgi:hypothetical protein